MARSPIRRLVERGIEAGADYIPDVVEGPLRGIMNMPDLAAKPRAPRPRQKPVVRRDNPGGEWLKHERRRADERVRGGDTKVSGAVTGYLKKPIELDPSKLEVIPGAMNERRVPGEAQYDRLRPLIEAEGFRQDSPILVGINHLGDPYIIEGNTRAAVARDLGIDRIPAEVRYFAGGEDVEGLMMPNRLEEFMPPSELALDPNFRRWFEGSKLRDEYGEPMAMYHATPEDFSVFKPGGVDPEISGHATWLSPYAEYQPAFHRVGARGGGFREGANVMPVYANMRNPLVLDDPGMTSWARDVFAEGSRSFPQLLPKNWLDNIRSEGYDGVIYKPAPLKTVEGDEILSDEYIVFDPKQIKSAIGNRGTYDPNDPDIRKARGGLAVKPRKYAVKKSRK
jgi:hypothetical protein